MGFWDNFTDSIKQGLQNDIEGLTKSVDTLGDSIPEKPQDMGSENGIGRQAIIDDPYYDGAVMSDIYKYKPTRLTNRTLKDVSVRDWLVSSIIQNRVDTMLMFSRPQKKRYDMGFKVIKKDLTKELTAEDKKNMAMLESYIYNCGRTDKTPEDDRMLFGDFLKLTARDAMTFGNITVEKILTRKGALHRFRPVPAENMYLVNPNAKKDDINEAMKQANQNKKIYEGENNPKKSQMVNKPDAKYYKYVQKGMNDEVLAVFSDKELIWKLFNPQNFADSMGYCYSPLELSIINITTHMNVESYNANFFTHGFAAKGILHLKGTTTQSKLNAFRRQFYNSITGATHAWRTPIISGLEDVQWVSLAGNAREMEYLEYNRHIMRSICSQFQIDPTEVGLENLSGKGSTGNEETAEYKITQSREKGLYPILMMFEDFVNQDIIPAIDDTFAERYRFIFTGYDDEAPQSKVAQLQAEMTVYSSMNDLLKEVGKEKIGETVADLPINDSFWGLVERNMTRGEIREKFLGDEGASQRRELMYIPQDPAFLQWQQMLMTLDQERAQLEAQKEQAEAEQQAQQEQAEMQQEQHEMAREQHDAEMEDRESKKAHTAANHKSLNDIAKEVGLGSSAANIGGTSIGNPVNSDIASDDT